MELWKFKIERQVQMPKGAKIVHTGLQFGVPHLWAIVEPSNPKVNRLIYTELTGLSIENPNSKYIGTVLISDSYVEHYFDGGEI